MVNIIVNLLNLILFIFFFFLVSSEILEFSFGEMNRWSFDYKLNATQKNRYQFTWTFQFVCTSSRKNKLNKSHQK